MRNTLRTTAIALASALHIILTGPALCSEKPFIQAANQNIIDADELRNLIQQAQKLGSEGKYPQALKIWEKLLEIAQKGWGEDGIPAASMLSNKAAMLAKMGQHAAAEPIYRRSLSIYEKAYPQEHPDVATALNNLAGFLSSQGKYADAEILYRRSLAIYEKTRGENHPDLALSLNNIAELLKNQGNYKSAEPLYRRSLAIYEKAMGPEHLDVAVSLNNLASLLTHQADYSRAEALLRRSYAIRLRLLGENHPDVALTLNNLGYILSRQGEHAAAESLYRRALSIYEQSIGREHQSITLPLNNLAALLNDVGRQADAEVLIQRVIAIREKIQGPDHPDVALSLNNLAEILAAQGRYEAAEPLSRRALTIREKSLGADHPDVAQSINNLALLLSSHGDYEAAEPLYRRSLAIYEKALGQEHPDVALILGNLAVVLDSQGRYAEAEPLQRRAIAIREKVLGPNHPGVALGLSNLALLLSNRGENAKAVQLGRQSLETYDKTLGKYSPHYTTALDNLAVFSIRIADYETATSMLQRSLAIQSAALIRELPLIPDQFRSSKLRKQGRSWEVIFGLIHSYPKASQPALEARLNRQGLLPEIERRQSLLLNSASSDRVKLAELKKLTQSLASVSLAADKRNEIREQRDKLQQDLYRQIPELEIKGVTTEQVANALPANSVLVEFQRYKPYEAGKTKTRFSDDSQYIALILRPDGSIKALPLGSAQAIDATIHQGLSASAEQQTDAQEIWTELSSKVLGPLLPYIGDSDQWFLSPDSELNRVPFAALPAPQQPTIPIGEVIQLRILTTGRELLSLQKDTPQGGPALVVANPTYDRKDSNRPHTTIAKAAQQRSTELESNKWRPLPATETEGRGVAALLSTNMISGPAATTASLQKTLGPRILHVATHGFFVSDQESKPNDPLRVVQDETSLLKELRQEDPLLRSGLVLAGANQPDIDPRDDGYLTAAEAVSLNLKGTELVVLSACSTGQGTIRTGEGVYGLQRSLTVAGARSTLLSLWKVDDAATAVFMSRYYQRLKDGEGRSEALAAVQKEFRNSPITAWRHPYYWAAWQLLGDWRPIKGI